MNMLKGENKKAGEWKRKKKKDSNNLNDYQIKKRNKKKKHESARSEVRDNQIRGKYTRKLMDQIQDEKKGTPKKER